MSSLATISSWPRNGAPSRGPITAAGKRRPAGNALPQGRLSRANLGICRLDLAHLHHFIGPPVRAGHASRAVPSAAPARSFAARSGRSRGRSLRRARAMEIRTLENAASPPSRMPKALNIASPSRPHPSRASARPGSTSCTAVPFRTSCRCASLCQTNLAQLPQFEE